MVTKFKTCAAILLELSRLLCLVTHTTACLVLALGQAASLSFLSVCHRRLETHGEGKPNGEHAGNPFSRSPSRFAVCVIYHKSRGRPADCLLMIRRKLVRRAMCCADSSSRSVCSWPGHPVRSLVAVCSPSQSHGSGKMVRGLSFTFSVVLLVVPFLFYCRLSLRCRLIDTLLWRSCELT